MCRPVRDRLIKMSGEVEKQRTEEDGGDEPSSPGDKKPERATSEYEDNKRINESVIHIRPSPCPFLSSVDCRFILGA